MSETESTTCPICGEGTLVTVDFGDQQPDSRQVQTFSCGHEVEGDLLQTADADQLDVERRQSEETVTPIDPEQASEARAAVGGFAGGGPSAARADPEGDVVTERDEQVVDEEIAPCHVCGQTFPTQVELSQHLMDAHEDDGLPTPGPGSPA